MGRNAAWISWILCLVISGASCFYPEYYVEDLCKRGGETIVYKTSEVGSAGTLRATSHAPYKPNKNCTILIQPPSDRGIVLSVRKIDMREWNYLCQDYIKIFHSDIFTSPTVLCHFQHDLLEKKSFYTKGPMTIVYHVGQGYYPRFSYEEGFTLTYTTVSEDFQDCIADNIFMCENGRCIPKTMTCDGRNNCGDRTDESHAVCDLGVSDYFHYIDVMYIVVFSLLIFSTTMVCIMVSRRRRRRSIDASLVSDSDELPVTLPPFQAVHPTGFGICQNPAGPNTVYSPHLKTAHQEGGFSNPCYPLPPPPPPYSQ